jgi:hypothetical protein
MQQLIVANNDKVTLTPDPRQAEIVLVCEYGYLGLPDIARLTREHGPRLMVFSESDWPLPILPGLYPSITRPQPWAQSWSYLPAPDLVANAAVGLAHLYSFLGRASTHPIRAQIVRHLNTPETPCIDTDAIGNSYFDRSRFLDLILKSAFTLCPRGFGASSIRAFEVMALGRVPVIISDAWVAPNVPGIDQCYIRVPERDILSIPSILNEASARAPEMGQNASAIFDQHFSRQAITTSLLPRLLQLREAGLQYSLFSRLGRSVDLRAIRNLMPIGAVRRGWSKLRNPTHKPE